ncbi:porin family protein [Marivirga salinae]|uniref:Porin family protein n=1 Tax=Marivirga salinarum TaxID=3059078 RepID=A0AA49GD11_9BACT|nr:porin family protein [Marivirga sp. BDSF4-3]WKK78725.1 porin family protein [Marivirga sp. BDSF4-3]
MALMATSALQAQHMNIGVKGGFNFYNVVNENNSDSESLPGFNVGLIGHFHLSDQFALQPELVFSTQGSKLSNNGDESHLNLNYLNIPILIQYMFDNGFRIFAGPQAGILLNAKSYTNNTEIDRTNDFNNMEIGASLGMSYINPNSNFGIDARYNVGLSDIYENDAQVAYNRGIQIGLFYLFKHK